MLTSNNLLTHHPIIFLTKSRFLHNSSSYWEGVPEFLEEHGYDVLEFKFHSYFLAKRLQELKAFLDLSKGDAYHFMGDSTTQQELKWLQRLNHPCVKTITLSEAPRHSRKNYINWAISLAENELTC